MEKTLEKVQTYDASSDLTEQEKITAWDEFLRLYQENNPNTDQDEQYRQRAKERLAYWTKQQKNQIKRNQSKNKHHHRR